MQKHIVVLSDGTGNSSGKLSRTNVWRVYETLDLADPQEPQEPRQYALYDNGVGTSRFKPLAILGGAFGYGLARNVRDLYTFICRVYQPGDKIFAFGFSRGAFTVRVLVAMMLSQGIVRYQGDESELQRFAKGAYRAWRKERRKKYCSDRVVAPLFRVLRDLFIGLTDIVARRTPYSACERIGRPGQADELCIEFLGLWDTVDAYGLPIDELTRAIDMLVWPLTMRDVNLDPRVKRAMHALSLDDERNTFHPRIWNETPIPDRPGTGVVGGNMTTKSISEERISQVWFAGVHSNVGGGYPDDGLAYVPLKWIMKEAECHHHLRFCKTLADRLWELQDENGPIYDSRKGLAGYYRYNPRRIERLVNDGGVMVGRVKIHESVLRRIQVGQDGYAPFVLPPGFAVAKIDGQIVDGSDYLSGTYSGGTPRTRVDVGPNSAYSQQRERVWNWVWRRRAWYFTTLFATLALLSMPLFVPGAQPCQSWACFISMAVDSLAAMLPSWASTWTSAFSSHPLWFAGLAALVASGLIRGGQLEQRIRDEMRAIWYQIDATRPESAASPVLRSGDSWFNRAIQWLRLKPAYQKALRLLTRQILPFAFGFVLLYLGAAFAWKLLFWWDLAKEAVCIGAESPVKVTRFEKGNSFKTDALCHPTRLMLEKGASYRIHVAIPSSHPWTDDGLPAGPEGLNLQASGWLTKLKMGLAVPLRRHLGQPWFMPTVRIGSAWTETYPLNPKPPLASSPENNASSSNACDETATRFPSVGALGQHYTAEIVARSGGELFVYVNDAIVGRPLAVDHFYRNNTGVGCVAVERIDPDKPPNE